MNSKDKDSPDYLFVKNPVTGEPMDVMPFVRIVERSKNRGASMADSIQKIHDRLSVMYLDQGSQLEAEALAELCAICIEIRDTFKCAKL